jgi:hypothetical protein
MLGSGSGIIPPSAVSAQAHASNMHITSAEKKQQTQNLNNRAMNLFECMLPLFSPAQLTSTDPKPATIKNTRNLSQFTFVQTENA